MNECNPEGPFKRLSYAVVHQLTMIVSKVALFRPSAFSSLYPPDPGRPGSPRGLGISFLLPSMSSSSESDNKESESSFSICQNFTVLSRPGIWFLVSTEWLGVGVYSDG